jgi:hypothetical protein
MVMVEPAYASAGPVRADRRAADKRRGAAALLTAVTSGLAVTRDASFARERFEQELRTLVRARSIALCDEPLAPVGPDVMCFDVPTTASVQRARLEAVFDSTRTLDGWTCQLLDTATHVAALILEIERCQGRRAGSRARPDGAAPLIGSSQAIRAVRERIERVAATDFTVLIEGGSGPQPHPGFIDVYPRAAVSWGDGKVAGAGEYAPEALNRRAERRSSPRNAAAV